MYYQPMHNCSSCRCCLVNKVIVLLRDIIFVCDIILHLLFHDTHIKDWCIVYFQEKRTVHKVANSYIIKQIYIVYAVYADRKFVNT